MHFILKNNKKSKKIIYLMKNVNNKKMIELVGRKGFYQILAMIRDNNEIILSDLLNIAGSGTIVDRREELLDLGLIKQVNKKIGRKNYIIYKLTPKGEKVLSLLEELIKTLKEED